VEAQISSLPDHLNWGAAFTERIVRHARARGWIEQVNGHLQLTDSGRVQARSLRGGTERDNADQQEERHRLFNQRAAGGASTQTHKTG
jgi:prophage tail gpP-like protein